MDRPIRTVTNWKYPKQTAATHVDIQASSRAHRRLAAVGSSCDLWCHDWGNSAVDRELGRAAIGHSKQRRGWQSTVSRWIRPCAPRAPILPRGDGPATCCTARRVTALGLGAGRRSQCLDAASVRSRSPECAASASASGMMPLAKMSIARSLPIPEPAVSSCQRSQSFDWVGALEDDSENGRESPTLCASRGQEAGRGDEPRDRMVGRPHSRPIPCGAPGSSRRARDSPCSNQRLSSSATSRFVSPPRCASDGERGRNPATPRRTPRCNGLTRTAWHGVQQRLDRR